MVTTIDICTSSVAGLVFDDGLRETSRTFGNGIVTTRAYARSDNFVTAINTASYPGLSFTYGTGGYDENKNPVQETTGGVMAGYSWTTAGGGTANYDEEDRLTYWNRPARPESREWPTGANTGLTDVGDWDSVIIDGVTQTRTHGSTHELTAIGANPITLDAKGNTTVDATKTTTHNYTWDFDNRMRYADVDGIPGNEIEQTYDALGRRVSKTVPVSGGGSTTTLYTCITAGLAESPHAGQVSSEYTANALPAAPLRKFVYGSYIDEPLLLIDKTNADGDNLGDNTAGEDYYFYHTNRQFCVTALTDSSAAIQERYAYTPYGSTLILAPNGSTTRAVSTFSNPYMYTGRRLDTETSLYYYRARYYDSNHGRFIGRDPILYEGSPWNLYEYVSGHTIKSIDPYGYTTVTFISEHTSSDDKIWWFFRSGKKYDLATERDASGEISNHPGNIVADILEEYTGCIHKLNLSGHGSSGGISTELGYGSSLNENMPQEYATRIGAKLCNNAVVNICACSSGEDRARQQRMANKLQAKTCACSGPVSRGCHCDGEWECLDPNDVDDAILRERQVNINEKKKE